MGLSVSLSNALSGMHTTQQGLEVLSRNVSNQGTPGYHRQSVVISERAGTSSAYAYVADVERAFSSSLQRQSNQEAAKFGFADVRAQFLSQVETMLGKPGDPTSLDKVYQEFENSMQALSTSPDDYTARSGVVSKAQTLASTLNGLSSSVQGLRQEAENQISAHVSELNRSLQSLERINDTLADQATNAAGRASILDERDRLVSSISELIDTRVEYRDNGTVSLMTDSGFGLLDRGATRFEFRSAGSISALSKFSLDDAENSVGSIIAITPSGLQIDVIEQDVVQSGRLAGLIDMRDKTLVEAQEQLDQLAGGLAQALSTITTEGTVVAGPPDGFSLDIANMKSGNDFTVSYSVNGSAKTVRVVNVDDASKLPMDKTGPSGERVIGLDFSGGAAAVAAALDTALGSVINVSNPSGSTIQIVDDGAGNMSDIRSLSGRRTVGADQGDGLALSLFVDNGNAPYTNSLSGNSQQTGFASRIAVNAAVKADNNLVVQHTVGGSLGDSSRPDYMLSNLNSMSFVARGVSSTSSGNFRLNGNVRSMISQTINFQGGSITAANDHKATAGLARNAVDQRLETEYGVNIDEEMARLIELQNAYAASARVVSTVQDLINSLMQI